MKIANFRRIFILTLVSIISVMLMGCTPKPISESEVKKVIEEYFLNEYRGDYNVSSEVVLRQTDKENKTDYVWTHIIAENDLVSVECDGELEYVLYNEGWQLNNCDLNNMHYDIKKTTVTEDEAKEMLLSDIVTEYDELSFENRATDLYSGNDTFVFHGKYSEGYMDKTDIIYVTYRFGLYDGWKYDMSNVGNTLEEWNVYGKWTYKSSDSDMWIEILDITENEIEIAYDFNYTCAYEKALSGMQLKKEHYVSNGTVRRALRCEGNEIAFNLVTDQSDTPYVYITPEGGLTFDGVWYNEEDTFVFYYEDGDGYQTRAESGLWSDEIYLNKKRLISFTNYVPTNSIESHNGNKFETLGYISNSTETAANTYNLYGQYKELHGTVVLNKNSQPENFGEIKIWGDNELLYCVQASELSPENSEKSIVVDVTGVKELTIECSGDPAFYYSEIFGSSHRFDDPVIGLHVSKVTK